MRPIHKKKKIEEIPYILLSVLSLSSLVYVLELDPNLDVKFLFEALNFILNFIEMIVDKVYSHTQDV